MLHLFFFNPLLFPSPSLNSLQQKERTTASISKVSRLGQENITLHTKNHRLLSPWPYVGNSHRWQNQPQAHRKGTEQAIITQSRNLHSLSVSALWQTTALASGWVCWCGCGFFFFCRWQGDLTGWDARRASTQWQRTLSIFAHKAVKGRLTTNCLQWKFFGLKRRLGLLRNAVDIKAVTAEMVFALKARDRSSSGRPLQRGADWKPWGWDFALPYSKGSGLNNQQKSCHALA